MKRPIKTLIASFALVAGTALAVGLYPPPKAPTAHPVAPITPPTQTIKRPKIEVVFVLDTTSSMTGLIDAAKNNIWSIASTMASAQPTPEMHMGLVAFRDRGDAYITQVSDLSTDLDSMYAKLMDYRAEGGGDGPESVNQALNEAVTRISWSQDPNSYKVIFLVGDAPPHMDYADDIKYPDTLKAATSKGIVINTIQAGDDTSTRQIWQQIASLNQGDYLQVSQSGNAVAVTTPFDDRLATLSRELDETRIFYGDADKRRTLELKTDAAKKSYAASPAAQAKRAEFNASAAGAANFFADSELINDVTTGRVKAEDIKPASLPAPLQSLSTEERKAVIEEKAKKRNEIQEQIAELGKQRQDYIAKELKSPEKIKDSLDGKIFETVRAQTKEKGLKYESAPAL